ncbi:carboxymuconolactone decarboxylase family protein [Burkholderia sp. Ax-1724]|uniref:carboxymuconolactone decarboxylase family protein n=1 Tax=Burkholderia sp. Ax-1724 TaxID=2608336 RepID=UPI00141ECAFE|nr:carboxymuconolactone decarboxylase family protein [Burkholderia sp. Ax-1724]NIF51597.1 carboxymuconolactone decarboxylase family protein [Burkholderia sp. Ax-1724]
MARIPYPDLSAGEIAPLVDRIVAERGRMLNLYSMLLHSPPVCEGWLSFLTAIRQRSLLPARVREMIIMRIAVINDADYEFQQHRPIALSVGVSEEEIDALRMGRLNGFDDRDRAVLAYCDSMTKNVHVPDDIFAAVRRHFDDRELVEVTATVGAYNLVSRFLEALHVDHDD